MGAGLFGLGAGTPSRFPYPDRPQPSPGVSPSPGIVVRANRVIVFGPGGTPVGVFVYQPGTTPALGNPPIATMGNSNVDPFGNVIKPDITAYGTGGSTSYVQLVPGNPANVVAATGDANEQTPGNMGAFVSGAGASRLLSTRLKSPVVSTFPNGTSRIDLFAAAVDNSSPAEFRSQVIDAGGVTSTSIFQTPTNINLSGPVTATTGAAATPTTVTTDTFHAMTLLNGWAAAAYARYRLNPDRTVTVQGIVSGGTITNGTLLWTAPAGYVPSLASTQNIPAQISTSTGTAGVLTPRLAISSGTPSLTLNNIPTGTTVFTFNGSYSLD